MTGAIVLAVVVLAALPGCSTYRAPTRGTVSGTFVETGGLVPMNGQTAQPIPLPGRVVAINSARQRVQVKIGRSGKFTLSLPPGTYQLIGYSPRITGVPCGAMHPVRVRVGTVLPHIQVICIVQ